MNLYIKTETIILIILLITINNVYNLINNNIEEGQSEWLKLDKADIDDALKLKILNKPAKNIILFVGDGMGPTTITASRIYSKSEKGYLSFEKFPHIGVLKTYSANKLVPDSSSTATALFCGVKANQKTSGVDGTVDLDDCDGSLREEARLDSIFVWAQNAGKSTGFVTTTRVTHATPSALYAHTPNRKWECESMIPMRKRKCKDIARQLIEDDPGKNINVIMGGGRQCLQSKVEDSPSDPVDKWACYSEDGRNLIQTWINDKIKRNLTYSYVKNNRELDCLNKSKDFVLGVFANGHLKFDYERDHGPNGMPSLAEMTDKALQVLLKNPNGFVLMVEGGLIDFGHHRGYARKALDETLRFSDAVQIVKNSTNINETLIIVTSDHSHSLVFSGYPSRSEGVLKLGGKSKIDQNPYTTLLYSTGGPNNYQYGVVNGTVQRTTPLDTGFFNYSQQTGILTDEVTHGGTDVLVYAKGPMAHLFNSVHEQTFVAHVISYAAKIGPLKDIYIEKNYLHSNNINNKNDNCIGMTFLITFLIIIFKYIN